MAKKLIITADDYGFSEGIDKSIIESYKKGIVTDISLLAVGDTFNHAVELAKKNSINRIGVHLTFTGPFKPLVSARFPKSYVTFFAKYFARLVSTSEIYTEFKNQIAKVKEEGFTITHLDSHQHIHMVPGILKVLIKLAKEKNIDYVRLPLERLGILARLADPLGCIRNILLLPMCNLAKRLLDLSGVKHNDYFVGHARAHRLRRKDLIFAISNLNEGLTELGCHLRYRGESKVLCDKSFIDEIKRHSIELISY